MRIVNEESGRKGISREKLKAAYEEERHLKWKEDFMNHSGNLPEITDQSIRKSVNGWQGVKLGQFTEEELNTIFRKLKTEKLQA